MSSDRELYHHTQNRRLEIIAIIAALLALTAPFVYLLRTSHPLAAKENGEPSFIGTQKCGECHQTALASWKDSHHDLAMQPATEQTILGDFNNARFTDPTTGFTSRFFRENGKYFVETEGTDGKPATFEVSHTFGVYPLQQYLVPFPDGKLQCLNIGWDVEKAQWYRLPPYDVEGADDWLHWTRGGQNWNSMCAECHSTRLNKGFDIETGGYTTSWFEINVGCEACHGPGSRHAEWAARPPMARKNIAEYGLAVSSHDLSAEQQIAICAPCHSRRFQLGDNDHGQGELLDKLVPTLLDEGLYHPDGQIREEVYVWGSFTQSKMYSHDVRCSDCHNVHSLKPHRQDNELCTSCHRPQVYDSPEHHFHKREHLGKPSDGHLCVKCHMPGQYYMGIDYRPDHSLRVPRPDLSVKIGTPNSCSATDCHADKDLQWVNDAYTKWYGTTSKPHYGETFFAARKGEANVGHELRTIASDSLLPAIVRATALSLLRSYPSAATTDTFTLALKDDEALLRYTALGSLTNPDRSTLLGLVAPKLYDPVKAVRIEAALLMASLPDSEIREDDRQALTDGLAEYRAAMLYNSDFAPQRYNLGNLANALGEAAQAEAYYLAAIEIDEQFYPAKVNLAMHYNRTGNNDKAETLLREVVAENPNLHEVAYSLGLLLAETGDYQGAVTYLGRAADGMAHYTRARYNQALAFLKLKRWAEGEQALLACLTAEPANREYFMTLANLYLNFRKTERARILAESTLSRVPDHEEAAQLLKILDPGR